MTLTQHLVNISRGLTFSSVLILMVILMAQSLGCRGTETEEDQLRRALEERAAQAPPRATVALGYIHQHQRKDFDDSRLVEAVDDATVEIERFYLVTSAIELHGCEAGHDATLGRRAPLRLPFTLVAEAQAHVPSSATRIGVPFVEDLLGPPNTARMIGGIAPPFGRYCRMYAILTPADDDVLNLTDALPDEIEGHTMLVKGRWRRGDDDEWRPFQWTSQARMAIEMDMIDATNHEPPLDLLEAGAHALVLVEKSLSAALFEGINQDVIEERRAADRLLTNLARTFRMYRYEAP